ncbi:Sec-independent protein translocase protein TatB [uncultured Psychromonas sp.]|uniref:Sec-independent protein translocase protein TatB n=1 Tax=uncultured Psychromonas sp. TaxID=173974 RepID=UPI0026181ACF|nr:Sec-independent protein translocase protein TatB [uncultured Psychromonas sp.]
MFDIGFWEIMLISVIGLVVLGPQRLPIAIRTVMKWVNTAKSMANSVKNEISQELELHEMNENMIKASKQGLDKIDPDLKASIDEMKESVEQLTRPYKNNVDDLMNAQAKSQKEAKAVDTDTQALTKNEKSEATISKVTPSELAPSKTIPQQEK